MGYQPIPLSPTARTVPFCIFRLTLDFPTATTNCWTYFLFFFKLTLFFVPFHWFPFQSPHPFFPLRNRYSPLIASSLKYHFPILLLPVICGLLSYPFFLNKISSSLHGAFNSARQAVHLPHPLYPLRPLDEVPSRPLQTKTHKYWASFMTDSQTFLLSYRDNKNCPLPQKTVLETSQKTLARAPTRS